MPDGSTTILLPIPPEALARLKRAEVRQRAETKKRGLLAVPVSVEGLILLQMRGGKVLCGCDCGGELDFTSKWDEKSPPPGYVVIAHRLARGSRGDHSPRNVSLDRYACNKRDASPDTSGAASVKRFTPDMSKKDAPTFSKEFNRPRRDGAKILSGGFRKHATMKRTVSGKVVPR